ncbi:hypothetical protein L3X38_037497 [Prunus dulcis]|uniref:Uncharacterized protein n=1 Tax=Prunus dulcis TaxID=3755 RepID=A0AAD4V382_PRUDU|nr:hypothetical protein L3X38_037497 [Prunus dulcis]
MAVPLISLRQELRRPTSISVLAKASSLPPLPSPPLFSDRKAGKWRRQRCEKLAKTADVTGDVSGHRELRHRLEQVLRPRIRSRLDPLRVKQRGTTSTAFVTPRTGSAVARYCPLWAWLHSHQPARFCFWELTKQLPRVVTHPGIAPASNSLNFGVPTNPKPVSSQKASRYEDARCAI